MYRLPWAKFTTLVTPKINVRPAATRNSDEALASRLADYASGLIDLVEQKNADLKKTL